MNQRARGLKTAGLGIALILLGTAAWTWQWLSRPLPLATDTVEVAIEPGTLPRAVARAWTDAGVLVDPRLLYAWFRLSGRAASIRAGNYELTQGMSARDLLRMMVRGDVRMSTVRFIEGWTFAQIRAQLARAQGLKPVAAAMSDADLMTGLGAPGVSPEGQFFPDTYSYSKGTEDLAVLRRAHRAMRRHLDDAWAQRRDGVPLRSAQDLLILASIVEKETGQAADRDLVSAVFNNRLRIGMPLQTDPTVIYGLGPAFDGNLRKRDLQTDTPYNTYLRAGLPPTPICMPGKDALLAAAMPAESKALYFVARGDGSSHFSHTLDEHNRAVDRYQRRRGAQP